MAERKGICTKSTHYYCFEKMGQFVALKKSGPKYGPEKKQGAKNRVIFIQKEKKQPGLLYSGPFFRPDFFKVPDPKKISGRPDKLE